MTSFDAQELFHLGMKASEKGDQEKAVKFYKESYHLEPKAETIYLLAAEYASLKMYDRAIESMQIALNGNPQLWAAYIQLGLLYLITGQHAEVKSATAPLMALEDNNFYKLFAQGYSSIVDGNALIAINYLEKGIVENKENLPLNTDMQQLIDQLSISTDGDEKTHIEKEGIENPASDYLLSKYKKSKH